MKLVLDEADEMLQANFLDQIENMFTMTKPNRQTLLFSATMPANVKYLVKTFMKDPEVIDVTSTESNLPKNVSHEVIYVPTNVWPQVPGEKVILRLFAGRSWPSHHACVAGAQASKVHDLHQHKATGL